VLIISLGKTYYGTFVYRFHNLFHGILWKDTIVLIINSSSDT